MISPPLKITSVLDQLDGVGPSLFIASDSATNFYLCMWVEKLCKSDRLLSVRLTAESALLLGFRTIPLREAFVRAVDGEVFEIVSLADTVVSVKSIASSDIESMSEESSWLPPADDYLTAHEARAVLDCVDMIQHD